MQILNETFSCDAHISITELHVAFGHTKKGNISEVRTELQSSKEKELEAYSSSSGRLQPLGEGTIHSVL